MAEREIVLLLVGVGIGVAGSIIRARVRHALALRQDRVKHQGALAERKARQLRAKLEHVTGKNGWELDLETVYSSLLSENGFEDESVTDLDGEETEEVENQS